MDKRTFLKTVTGAAMAFSFVDDAIAKVVHLSPNDVAQDENFWATIRKGFRLKPDYINLENGYYLTRLLPYRAIFPVSISPAIQPGFAQSIHFVAIIRQRHG